MEGGREIAKAKASNRCVRCVAVRNYQKVAHGGTATTAQNEEGREIAKAKASGRCVRCVAVRDFQKVAHGGTAFTAQNQTAAGSHILTYFCETIAGEQVAAHGQQDDCGGGKFLQALCSLCRCEKNKKLAHGGTATTARNGEGGGRLVGRRKKRV